MLRVFAALAATFALLGGAIVLARATSHPIAGIQCDPSEGAAYHIHTFLTLVDHGRRHHPPANVGIHWEHLCLYWLHTHDDSGIIHVEAPRGVHPTLGQFFAIWGEPISRVRVAQNSVHRGERMRVFLDGHAYHRNPASIPLTNHSSITIEIGPPFVPPIRGSFKGL